MSQALPVAQTNMRYQVFAYGGHGIILHNAGEGVEQRKAPRNSNRVLSPDNLSYSDYSTASEDVKVSGPEPASSVYQIKLLDGRAYWCNDHEERITSSYDRGHQRDLARLWSSSNSLTSAEVVGVPSSCDPNNYSRERCAQLNYGD